MSRKALRLTGALSPQTFQLRRTKLLAAIIETLSTTTTGACMGLDHIYSVGIPKKSGMQGWGDW
jgi:hypothetical protein